MVASSANPDLWSDLSGLGLADANSLDARAALLKVNAEMFVAAPARDRESIETFETLVLGFLPRTDRETLLDLARILAPCQDTPASILDFLMRHSPDTRAIVLRHAARLPRPASTKPLAYREGRLRLASDPHLDAATVRRLLVLGESEVEDALALNPALPSTGSDFEELLQRARHRPALATLLLERQNLTVADEAALYLAANHERRSRIRERMATLLEHRRAVLSFHLTEQDRAEFLALALEGDARRLEALLTAAFSLPAKADWRSLEIVRHRLLALALKALGMPQRDATKIFLTLHPALSCPLSRLKELVREVRDVPSPVALALVEAILGVKALSGEPERV